jgi:hypothetical protein
MSLHWERALQTLVSVGISAPRLVIDRRFIYPSTAHHGEGAT